MRHPATIRMFASAGALALITALAGQASAQEAQQVEEIVVTAQKREQNLQDVPVAVSAFGSQQLEAQSVNSLTDLSAKAPNVVLAPVGAYPYASAFFIRGLGFADVESTFEPSVGVEMNGVYLARNSGALQDFFDIESVEILRGPQGTLYGRNTIGGVVSVRTKKPVVGAGFNGAVQVTVGDHGRQEGRLAVEVPLGDVFAARASVLYKSYDGYNRNVTLNKREGDNEVLSGRFTLVAKPSDTFDASLVVDFDQEDGSGGSFRNASLPGNVFYQLSPTTGAPGVPPFTADQINQAKNVYNVFSGTPSFAEIDTWGVALTANWHLDYGTLTSITGYREFDDLVQSDYDGSAVNMFAALRDQTHKQFSQELRLAGEFGDKIDYVMGLYFMDQEYAITNTQSGLLFGGASLKQIASQENQAWASFGQLDWHVDDKMTITAGGRVSYEKKTFKNQPLGSPVSKTFEDEWGNFSPKVGVNYEFTPRVMGYVTWSRGFRSGGFNGRASRPETAGPYDSETVDSLEAGVKSELFDRRLRLNGAVFTSNYSDMQVSSQRFIGGKYESVVLNAGEARISGAEAEALWIVGGGWRLNANVAYLDAEFVSNFTDLDGNGVAEDNSDLPMAYAPKWSGSVGVNYVRDTPLGEFGFNANAVYTDDMYTSGGALNRVSNVQVRPSNTLVDATISLTGTQGWKVSLWGKNLMDEEVINNTFNIGPLGNLRIYQAPRTWGLEVGYKF